MPDRHHPRCGDRSGGTTESSLREAPTRMSRPIRIAWTRAGRSWLRAGSGARRSASTSIATARASGCLTAAPRPTIAPASSLAPIQKFDASGRLVTSFGAGMFNYPHGLFVDRDGNVWVSDGRAKNGKGHTVMKFSPDGKLLMTLGKPGVAGDGPDTFNAPSDILIAPNGDIFVADGHGGDTNARIVKLSKDGKFIKAWGKKGTAPGEFDAPHGLPWIPPGGCSSPTARTAASRCSTRTVNSSPSGGNSAGRAASSSTRRTSSTSPTRNRRPGQSGLQAGHSDRERQGRQGHSLHSVGRNEHAGRRRGG